jgi:hypothetical protein
MGMKKSCWRCLLQLRPIDKTGEGEVGIQRSGKTGNRGNRELKRLECTVNYEVKGSSKVSGKGRAGKYCK